MSTDTLHPADCAGIEAPLFTVDRNRRIGSREFTYLRCARCWLIRLGDAPEDLARYYPQAYYELPRIEELVKGDKQSATAVSLPFGRTTETAIAGDRFYAGHSERYEIGRYDAHGRLELLIRLRRDPVPVTSADVDRFKARRVAEAEDQGRPRIERMYAEMPFPATFPAFGGLLVDALGGLWVLVFAAPGDTTRRWTVFGPDGVALGVVQTPPGLNVREIGRDYVLGTWRDADEVEHVRLYALRRR